MKKRIMAASSIAVVVVALGTAILACTLTQVLETPGARGGNGGLSPTEEHLLKPEEVGRDSQMPRSIEEVKEAWEEHLLALPGVMGVGIGLTQDGQEKAITVYVNRQASEQAAQIPRTIEGYPVEVEIRGIFRAW